MPRIPPGAIRQAHKISPHAATILPACRDLPSALNELRWIREHVEDLQRGRAPSPSRTEHQVASLCRRRGRGVPLQYVLGSQPFGNLDLKCRPGVLIPRYFISLSFSLLPLPHMPLPQVQLRRLTMSEVALDKKGLSLKPTQRTWPASSNGAFSWERGTTSPRRPSASWTCARERAASPCSSTRSFTTPFPRACTSSASTSRPRP